MIQLQNLLGETGIKYAIWIGLGLIALIVVLILLLVARKLFGPAFNMSGAVDRRNRPPRLGVTDFFNLDRHGRKLVIVRRDNIEHLVLIGGPNDVVIEQNIIRGTRPELPITETSNRPTLASNTASNSASKNPTVISLDNPSSSVINQPVARIEPLSKEPPQTAMLAAQNIDRLMAETVKTLEPARTNTARLEPSRLEPNRYEPTIRDPAPIGVDKAPVIIPKPLSDIKATVQTNLQVPPNQSVAAKPVAPVPVTKIDKIEPAQTTVEQPSIETAQNIPVIPKVPPAPPVQIQPVQMSQPSPAPTSTLSTALETAKKPISVALGDVTKRFEEALRRTSTGTPPMTPTKLVMQPEPAPIKPVTDTAPKAKPVDVPARPLEPAKSIEPALDLEQEMARLLGRSPSGGSNP